MSFGHDLKASAIPFLLESGPCGTQAPALRDGLADLLLEARLPESTWHQFRSSRAQLGEPLAALVMRQVDRGIQPDDAMLRAAFLARQFADHDYSDDKAINRLEAWLRDASPALRSRAFWIQDAIFNDLFASGPDERLFRNSRYGLIQVPQTGDAPWLEAEVAGRTLPAGRRPGSRRPDRAGRARADG